MKALVFWFKFHWNLFLRVRLTTINFVSCFGKPLSKPMTVQLVFQALLYVTMHHFQMKGIKQLGFYRIRSWSDSNPLPGPMLDSMCSRLYYTNAYVCNTKLHWPIWHLIYLFKNNGWYHSCWEESRRIIIIFQFIAKASNESVCKIAGIEWKLYRNFGPEQMQAWKDSVLLLRGHD